MNKKTLELMLKTGEVITFQDPKDKQFIKVGGAGKNRNGNYRHSGWCDTKEECNYSIGDNSGYTLDNLLDFKFISNEPYSFGEPVPVGTKVEIIETGDIKVIEKKEGGVYCMKEDFDRNYSNAYKVMYTRQNFRIHFEEEKEEIKLNDENAIYFIKEIKKILEKQEEKKSADIFEIEDTKDGGLKITFRKI